MIEEKKREKGEKGKREKTKEIPSPSDGGKIGCG